MEFPPSPIASILPFILLLFPFALRCRYLAKRKGLNPTTYFWLGYIPFVGTLVMMQLGVMTVQSVLDDLKSLREEVKALKLASTKE